MPAAVLFGLLSVKQYVFLFKKDVLRDDSYATIHTVHLRLIYEAKIQMLSVFSSWKPAQPRCAFLFRKRSMPFSGHLNFFLTVNEFFSTKLKKKENLQVTTS